MVAPAAMYGGTYCFLRNVAAKFGVQTDFVDMTSLAAVRAALRPDTGIVYAETLANPTVAVADLPALADLAHTRGALLVVDSTFAPPVLCRPWSMGPTWSCTPQRNTSAATRTRPAGWSAERLT